ncbi:DUF4331 domain-containing protein [Calidithermus chliarophilus]|uniref:DUF4331 domain-containing protein n=1 Tax=Calidithermus chliarophilus TaxID=52023 RepID=UPI000418C9FE|nr:DUF4331 domain-containing protein [Calidithermus chliarophilus]
MRKSIKAILVSAALGLAAVGAFVAASDHDDGEADTKARALNLTDLYVFREIDQNPRAKADDLIFVMNTNPRSLARQQYYFSTNARYEFRLTRVLGKDDPATGQTDAFFRLEFGAPDKNGQQPITLTASRAGVTRTVKATADGKPILTTPLTARPVVNQVPLDRGGVSVFAGLREDPFFFDVEQFFRVRAGLAGLGPSVGFRSPGYDFTAGYNVNSIVVRAPMEWLTAGSIAKTFDVWATISIPDPAKPGEWKQVERLARPAVNEGLLLTNDYLNTLNAVGPDFEAAVLKGDKAASEAAAPIVGEVSTVLKLLGNSPERVGALLGAFLPDVMRIDTTGPSGYANDLNKRGSPVRGRMLKDDVIDITLQVLSNGAVKGDNVSYDGPNAGGSKHKPLLGEFPYLADPN